MSDRAPPRTARFWLRRRAWAWSGLGLVALATVAFAAQDEPILPGAIRNDPIEMKARYARQWRQPDGVHVILFTGDFRLVFGRQRMRAAEAVVWIERLRAEADGRPYYEATVYLSGNAEVLEPGGTLTLDDNLLVVGMRTFGQVIKSHDAHVVEADENAGLYRAAVEARQRRDTPAIAAAPDEPAGPVARPVPPARPPAEPVTPRVVRYRLPSIEPAKTSSGEDVFVAIGAGKPRSERVYFSQSGRVDDPVLEITADTAVVFPAEELAEALLGETDGDAPETRARAEARETDRADANDAEDSPDSDADPDAEPPPGTPPRPVRRDESSDSATAPPAGPVEALDDDGVFRSPAGIARRIRAVYLEGDVVLSYGTRFIRTDRLYYDFERDQALILDAVLRADLPDRGVPLYIRAEEIRQLSAREFRATGAQVTTSEFRTPHYHVGAERVTLVDRTQVQAGASPEKIQGTYELRHATFNIGGVPFTYWPYARGDLESSETLLRRASFGHSDDFGFTARTAWYLFNLLGVPRPEGYDATLHMDYFSDRGPAIGVDSDYAREDHYGLFRGYYINDGGEDNLGPLRDGEPDSNNRGRVLWRHRHYLPYDWEATFEISYISDPTWLEEYRRSEFFEGKDQETLVYLKRVKDVEAISILANWRLLDFLTQTEHLPDVVYRRIGDTFLDPLVLYHESRVGVVRYRPDDRRIFDDGRLDNLNTSDATFRSEVRQEAELPLKAGPVNIVPFASLRGGFWDGSTLHDGHLWRGLGVYGVRGGTRLWRIFESVRSELFDIDGIRHIIRPEYAVWWAHSNARSDLITPFDEGVETVDDFYGGMAAIRQAWQTRRGAGAFRRSVDLFTLDLEAGFFGDPQTGEKSNGYVNPLRPEDSRTRNYLAADAAYRISDTTSLLYDFNFDLNDGNFDRHNVSVAVERLPRLAYVAGVRHAGDIDLNLVGGGFNYKLNQKHIVASRTWFDIDSGDLGEFAVSYVYKLPRWYVAVNAEWDRVFDDFSLSLSIWPEGIPEWTLGSRRFTGLSSTTGIRP